MQGIFIDGKRPKSKKAVKEAVASNPRSVHCEATSMFGNEHDCSAADLPVGAQVSFVGPDPYTKRVFYGSLTRTANGGLVVK